MTFTPDIEASLKVIVNLLNTEVQIVDMLSSVADLDEFLDSQHFTADRAHNQAELRSIRQLRSQLKSIWTASEEDAVFRVNQILRTANAQPQLIKSPRRGYKLHATTMSSPLYDRFAVNAAMALAEVILAGGLERLRICEPFKAVLRCGKLRQPGARAGLPRPQGFRRQITSKFGDPYSPLAMPNSKMKTYPARQVSCRKDRS